MLNQTNIGHNNNKYYIIQVVKNARGQYYAWNRWGRVVRIDLYVFLCVCVCVCVCVVCVCV